MNRRFSKFALIALALTSSTVLATQGLKAASNYIAIDEFSKPRFSINSSALLQDGRLPTATINFSDRQLLKVLVNTKDYFVRFSGEDPTINRDGILGSKGVTVAKVQETLDFMIQVLQEDLAANRPTRLRDANFINANFRVINWSPFNPRNLQQRQKLRLTKYAVFIHEGSRQKTSKFNVALYALPDNLGTDQFYKKYTKQQVLAGLYEPGGKEFGKVKPLVYLTRDAFEEALMQGTILIKFTDGTSAYFNVDRNNGIAYVKGLAAGAQQRYWYFRQVDAIKGYGNKIQNKISIEPGVTFAGDVFNLGLGRIVALEVNPQGNRPQMILGVVADTGGAFMPNLYQLDFLAGTFRNRQEFSQRIRTMPEFVKAYILVKK